MQHPASWLAQHLGGWYCWMPGIVLLSGTLCWARRHPERRKLLPYVVLGLWLATTVAGYIGTGWHHYIYNRALWAGGVASMLAVDGIALLVCLLVEEVLVRCRVSALWASLSSAVAALLVVFLSDVVVSVRVALWVYRALKPS